MTSREYLQARSQRFDSCGSRTDQGILSQELRDFEREYVSTEEPAPAPSFKYPPLSECHRQALELDGKHSTYFNWHPECRGGKWIHENSIFCWVP
jgi:hypothetical protein